MQFVSLLLCYCGVFWCCFVRLLLPGLCLWCCLLCSGLIWLLCWLVSVGCIGGLFLCLIVLFYSDVCYTVVLFLNLFDFIYLGLLFWCLFIWLVVLLFIVLIVLLMELIYLWLIWFNVCVRLGYFARYKWLWCCYCLWLLFLLWLIVLLCSLCWILY